MGGERFSTAVPHANYGSNSFVWSFERVENSGGIQASLAGRYATALFGLARDEQQIDAVGRSLDTLEAAMTESADFKALVSSPLIGRAEAGKTIRALIPALGVDPISAKFLGVLADNGRLLELKVVIKAFRKLAADNRGETAAEVTSAFPLSDDQVARIKSNLKARLGRDVAIDAKVDPQLLGGLVVRLGSQMIDASIRTKLNNLALAMRG
jgi:F-type H+-transporting ATPase subunit delta